MVPPKTVFTVDPCFVRRSEVTPKKTPVIRLIKINESPAANAPPARSYAQLPPIANANKM